MCRFLIVRAILLIALALLASCKGKSPVAPNSFRPIAIAGVEGESHFAGKPVKFFDNGSHDPDGGEIVKFQWDWNNDSIWDEEGKEVSQVWDEPGTYSVLFRVTDDEGVTDTIDEPLKVVVENGIPDQPVDITPPWLNLNSSPSSSFVAGKYLYVGGAGLNIYDISDMVDPEWVSWVDTGNSRSVAVSGSYAYVASNDAGLVIVDVSSPITPQIVKSVGMAGPKDVAVTGSYVYVVVHAGIHVVDATQPQNASIVYSIWSPATGYQMETYAAAISGSRLYIIGFKESIVYPKYVARMGWLTSYDISDPSHPFSIGSKILDWTSELATEIAVDVTATQDRVFMVTQGDIYSPASLIIADADSLATIGTFVTLGPASNTAVSENAAYICGNRESSPGFVEIVDITTPESPSLLGSLDFTSPVSGVTVSGETAYVSERSLSIVDINPPDSPRVVNKIGFLGSASGVAVSGSYVYAVDGDSLKVIDFSLPSQAHVVKTVYTQGEARDIAVSGSYAYLTAAFFTILDISTPTSPVLLQELDVPPGYAYSVEISGSHAYLANDEAGLNVVDVGSPGSASVVGSLAISDGAVDVAVSGSSAYVAGCPNDLTVVDISDPTHPGSLSTLDVPDCGNAIDVSGSFAYLVIGNVLNLVALSTPGSESITLTVSGVPLICNVVVSGQYTYCVKSSGQLVVLDIDPPDQMTIMAEVDTTGQPTELAVSGRYAFVAAGEAGLRIFKLW